MFAVPAKIFSPRTKHNMESIMENGELLFTPTRTNYEKYYSPSEKRKYRLIIGDKLFYVDMEKLVNSSERKNISWDINIKPKIFHLVLIIIDGDDCSMPDEDMPEVLRFGAHSRVTPVLQKCWEFMSNGGLLRMPVDMLLEVFDIFDKEIRNCQYGLMGNAYVVKALLEHKDQNDMFNAMLMSSHKIVPYLKKGVKEIKKLEHRWKDQEMVGNCPCAQALKNNMFNKILPHHSLSCSTCFQEACRICSSRICPKAIVINILKPLSTPPPPTATSSLPPYRFNRPPSPGMPLLSPERSTTPPISCDRPITPPLAHSTPKSTPRQRSRYLFANKGVV